MKSALVAALAVGAMTSAGCAATAAPVRVLATTSIPPGWVRHVLGGVSFAAPSDWTIGPYTACAPRTAKTVGVGTSDMHDLGRNGAVEIEVTNLPAEKAPSTQSAPTAAWVSIECVVAPRVGLPLPADTIVKTSGAQKVLMRSSDPFYIIGHGQAVAVAAGASLVGQQIVRTVVPANRRC